MTRLIRSARDAEQAALEFFLSLGYSDARLTGFGADRGVDVEAVDLVVQVKAHAKPVGLGEVQRIQGIARHQDKTGALMALDRFTTKARAWADEAEIALFTFDLQGEVQPANHFAQVLIDSAVGSDWQTPPLWRHNLDDASIETINADMVGLIHNGTFVALDLGSGGELWRHDLDDAWIELFNADMVGFHHNGTFVALDLGAGDELWRIDLPDGTDVHAVPAAGKLVVTRSPLDDRDDDGRMLDEYRALGVSGSNEPVILWTARLSAVTLVRECANYLVVTHTTKPERSGTIEVRSMRTFDLIASVPGDHYLLDYTPDMTLITTTRELGGNFTVSAIDGLSGKVRWSSAYPFENWGHTETIGCGLLALGNRREVVLLDLATGTEVLRKQLAELIRRLEIAGPPDAPYLLAICSRHSYGIDPRNGDVLWRSELTDLKPLGNYQLWRYESKVWLNRCGKVVVSWSPAGPGEDLRGVVIGKSHTIVRCASWLAAYPTPPWLAGECFSDDKFVWL